MEDPSRRGAAAATEGGGGEDGGTPSTAPPKPETHPPVVPPLPAPPTAPPPPPAAIPRVPPAAASAAAAPTSPSHTNHNHPPRPQPHHPPVPPPLPTTAPTGGCSNNNTPAWVVAAAAAAAQHPPPATTATTAASGPEPAASAQPAPPPGATAQNTGAAKTTFQQQQKQQPPAPPPPAPPNVVRQQPASLALEPSASAAAVVAGDTSTAAATTKDRDDSASASAAPPPAPLAHALFAPRGETAAATTTKTTAMVASSRPSNDFTSAPRSIMLLEDDNINDNRDNNQVEVMDTGGESGGGGGALDKVQEVLECPPDETRGEKGVAIGSSSNNNNNNSNKKRHRHHHHPNYHDREWRRKRRRRLCHLLQRTRGSFTALLHANYDVSDDDDDENDDDAIQAGHQQQQPPQEARQQPLPLAQLPRRIRIDLDAELGLKAAPRAAFVKQECRDGDGNAVVLYRQILPDGTLAADDDPPDEETAAISSSSSSQQQQQQQQQQHALADEGWYEGAVPVALPEDGQYLNRTQRWIRENLEFFSTTAGLSRSLSGRFRTKHRGQVGVRCRHCAARAAASAFAASGVAAAGPFSWPTGAIAYPPSVQNVYLTCSQRLSHLEACPNLPPRSRRELLGIREESGDAASGRRSRTDGISAGQYSVISARRIGLADADEGLRFSRDVTLDPLPFETARMQVQSDQQQQQQAAAGPAGGGGGGGGSDSIMDTDLADGSGGPRIAADAESEAVLAEAITSWDDYPADNALTESDDKKMVTDYLFLLVRQLSTCWSGPADLMNRRLKALGFAGVCCRWCRHEDGQLHPEQDPKCRSFPNSPDSMKAPVSVGFANHVQKCPEVPLRIKRALASYKKIHAQQMSQVPFGSQKRFWVLLFARLRALDRSGDGSGAPPLPTNVASAAPPVAPSAYPSKRETHPGGNNKAPIIEEEEEKLNDGTYERPASFPECTDPETKEILSKSLSDWDPEENDNLLLPSDRRLISDYVFLTMRQLRSVLPDRFDSQRIRHTIHMPGIACTHCIDQSRNDFSPSGRSFPSAPDNFASALNTSLYNHMQACPFVPQELKRALVNTRKIHSAQCSSFKFGSQRKFFNLLYQRLESARKSEKEENDADSSSSMKLDEPEVCDSEKESTIEIATKEFLTEHGFLEVANDGPNTYCYCQQCVMVPVQFRAPGSVFFQYPPADVVRSHSIECRKSTLHLGTVVDLLDQLVKANGGQYGSLLTKNRGSFKLLVRAAVGSDDKLTEVFGDHLLELIQHKRDGKDPITTNIVPVDIRDISFPPANVDYESMEVAFRPISLALPGTSEILGDHPELIQFLQLISPLLVTPRNREHDQTTKNEP